MPTSFEILQGEVTSNPITNELYRKHYKNLTSRTTLPRKGQIILHIANALCDFTETEYPQVPNSNIIRDNDLDVYSKICALLIHEIAHNECARNANLQTSEAREHIMNLIK